MTAFEVSYQGKAKTLQDWAKGVSLRDKARLGPDERINFRDVVNVISGLALNNQFAEDAPEYPAFSALVTEANRKQLVSNAMRALAGGSRTKDAIIILDGLEMLDGDRIEPTRSRYAKDVLDRLKAKGHGQVLNRSDLLSGDGDVEFFSPIKFRLEPDLLVTVLGALVYAGDVVLAVTGDKIDSGKISLLAERSLDDLKQFKHVEAPKEINVAILRSLFELLGLPPGLAQQATQGSDEPVKLLQEEVGKLTRRVLGATTDMSGRLSFWGQSLLRDEEIADRRNKLESLKAFSESLAPYNTVGKLKNLRIGSEDIAAQTKNLEALKAIEGLLDLVAELGPTAGYLSQAEMVLSPDHAWVKQAQDARKHLLEQLAADSGGQSAADYRQTLATLKRNYLTAYVGQHSTARLGVAEDKTKISLKRDSRLVAIRALAGISLMPTSQLTTFEEKLDKLKSCTALVESDLAATPVCPTCGFRPANEQGVLIPAANVLKQLDDELDRLINDWRQSLLENLDDPIVVSNLDLLKTAARGHINEFISSKKIPEPVSPDFVAAVQEALSGLEKVSVSGEDIRQALLLGGSPASPDDLRRRFETFLSDRCKGKDTTKLRFVVE